jgi:hypothetical protein
MRLLLATLVLALVSPAASAALITYNYKGYVLEGGAFGIFSDVDLGDEVSGTFSVDDQLLDLHAGDASDRFANYWGDSPALSNSFAATINFGSWAFDLGPNRRGSLDFRDGSCLPRSDCDAVLLDVGSDAAGLQLFAVDLISPFAGVYSNAVAEGANNLTSTMSGAISILDRIDPSSFNYWDTVWSNFRMAGGPGERNEMYFRWTEISRAPISVPEPATMLLFGAGLFGIGVMRRRRN